MRKAKSQWHKFQSMISASQSKSPTTRHPRRAQVISIGSARRESTGTSSCSHRRSLQRVAKEAQETSIQPFWKGLIGQQTIQWSAVRSPKTRYLTLSQDPRVSKPPQAKDNSRQLNHRVRPWTSNHNSRITGSARLRTEGEARPSPPRQRLSIFDYNFDQNTRATKSLHIFITGQYKLINAHSSLKLIQFNCSLIYILNGCTRLNCA